MKSEETLKSEIAAKEQELTVLRKELSELYRRKSQQSSESYNKKKELLDEAAPVFAKIVKAGDFVKVTGAKSARTRKVKEISKGILIACACHTTKTGKIKYIDEYDIRTCGTNKITHLLVEGVWKSAKQILEENCDE